MLRRVTANRKPIYMAIAKAGLRKANRAYADCLPIKAEI